MRRLRSLAITKFLDRSLTTKLLWIFVLLIFIPMFSTNLIAYIQFKNNVRANAESYTNNIIEKMLGDMDESTKEIERFSMLLLFNKQFEADLSAGDDEYDKAKRLGFYIDFLQSAMKSGSSAVYLLDPEGHAYFNNTIRPNAEAKFKNWYELAAGNDGNAVIAGTDPVTDYFGQQRYLLTTVRALRSRYDLHPLGVMVIDFDLSSYRGLIDQLDQLTKGTATVVDPKGQVILQSGTPEFSRRLQSLLRRKGVAGGNGHLTFRDEDVDYLVNYRTSDQTGWTMAVATPLPELLKNARSTRNLTILVTTGATALALLVAGAAVLLLTRPLRRMERLMTGVQDGNFDIRFRIRSRDEIGRLGLHFNRMVQRIGELIEEVYVMSLRKNKAELEALQSQINPHFLYNTLEMIRMAAEMNRDPQVSHMVFVLGKLLRYGVNRSGELVPANMELEHVQNYLFLYNLRSGDQTTIEFAVPEPLRQLPMPRLALQPIVENALLHAKREGRPLRVAIRAFEDGDGVRFEVADNGAGMPAERLAELRAELEGAGEAARTPDHAGIGLRNIHDRIRLLYGRRYGLELDSELGRGTRATIRLPSPERLPAAGGGRTAQ